MKIIKNEKLIKRNGQIGQVTSLAALVILGLGMYISFSKPELFSYSIGALLVGFMLTQVGMYMGNRYGRSPRPDEKFDAGLKGLPGDFTIYHYSAPVSHVLVGPAGIWILMPYHQRGKLSYRKNRWHMSGGGFLQGYMRLFGQEGIGRPDLEAENEILTLKKFLLKNMEEAEIPEIQSSLIFTNEEVEIEAGESPVPAMKLKQLKDFMRQKGKEKPIGALTLDRIKKVFEK
jgi:hypothetical protein